MRDNIQSLNFGTGLVYEEFTFSKADLTTAGLTQAIDLLVLPAGHSFIFGVFIKHDTQFAAPGATNLTVSVGSSTAGAAGYATAFEVLAVASAATTMQWSSFLGRGTTAAETIQATFTSVAGNVNTMTAGSVTVGVLWANISTPATW